MQHFTANLLYCHKAQPSISLRFILYSSHIQAKTLFHEPNRGMAKKEGQPHAAKAEDDLLTSVRKVGSTILTLTAVGLIVYAIGMNYAALPGHPAVHYILFVFVLILLGYLEGLQIAILEMEKSRLPETDAFKRKYSRGICTLKLATEDNGRNVQRFLIGRQFFVVFVVFLCAQLTTYPKLPKDGWPEWLFVLVIDTGLPGALVVLSFGQLMPQLVAATHPMGFMNLPGAWNVVKLALILESLGIAHFSWVLSSLVKYLGKLGEAEENFDPAAVKLVAPREINSNDGDVLLPYDKESMSVSCEDAINKGVRFSKDLGREDASPGHVTVTVGNDNENAATPPWLTKIKNVDKYKDWGYNPETGARFPSPADVGKFLVSKGERVPRYLLPPEHHSHIPPHVVAYDLMLNQEVLQEQITALTRNEQALVEQIEALTRAQKADKGEKL